MNKNVRRAASIVLAATMLSGLAACGLDTSSGTKAAETTAKAETAAKAEAAGKEAGDASKYPKLDIKLSSAGTEQGIDSIAAYHFADLVKEASGGQITVSVYASAQLAGGDMAKNMELLSSGGVFELAIASGSVLGNADEKFLIHQIPFLFNSYDEAAEYMDSTGGEYYEKLAATKGVKLLSGLYNGLRQLTNSKHEVHTPADMKNMKIRVPSGQVYIEAMKAFGADPVAMNWTEVFTALQQGTLDGHENGYQTLYSANIHEVQDYITEWNWSFDGYWFAANQAAFDKWDEATQQLIVEKAKEASDWARAEMVVREAAIKEELIKDYGITITELTDEEKQQFIDAVKPVREYFIDKYGEEGCAAWGLVKE